MLRATHLFSSCLAALCLQLAACASQTEVRAPVVALAMEGPQLAIVGEYAGMALEGAMQRGCMAGYGTLMLQATGENQTFSCEASVDDPPTEKGRVRGMLRCSNNRKLLFSLRNIGPDQGVGVARETEEGDLMIFFYHSAPDEAQRRFPSVKEDIHAAMNRQK